MYLKNGENGEKCYGEFGRANGKFHHFHHFHHELLPRRYNARMLLSSLPSASYPRPVKSCLKDPTLVNSDGARLDVRCINLWFPLSRPFIDVRMFNPQAQNNWNKTFLAIMYVSHQNEKKTEYGPRAREVEKATLTAAVMSTSRRSYGKGDGCVG